MTGIIVLICNDSIPGDGRPQAGQIDPLDGPKIDEATRVDEMESRLRGSHAQRRGQAKGPRTMRIEFFQIQSGHELIIIRRYALTVYLSRWNRIG